MLEGEHEDRKPGIEELTESLKKYEIGITISISRSTDVSDYKSVVYAKNRYDAILEALIKLKMKVLSNKRSPLLQNIFSKDYKFTITLHGDEKFGHNAQHKIGFRIPARSMEQALERAMHNESISQNSIERIDAIFESTINHIVGIDDGTWPNGIESKMTLEEKKKMNALVDEVKARALKSFGKK